jgi:hypothetical protein
VATCTASVFTGRRRNIFGWSFFYKEVAPAGAENRCFDLIKTNLLLFRTLKVSKPASIFKPIAASSARYALEKISLYGTFLILLTK